MSTPPPQPPASQAGPPHTEASRFRSTAATTGLVALITLRELARRRGALALATLLPLVFYLVRLEAHWTAIRLLSIGLGWATATLALFTQVSSRSVDRRLTVNGADPTALLLGRHLAVLGLGWAVGLLYSGLVLTTIGDELTRPGTVPVMLLLTAAVAAPLGSLAAALVPRDLEGALLLLSVMAIQVLVDPSEGWTRVLPLWSTRELASVVVENLGSQTATYLHRGLAHGVATAVLLTAASWAVGALRLRTVRIPAPSPAEPAYS
ncbi:ABC transporter permease [Actinomyces sp. ZJ308]|uniref:ABC transporter permease n=1 Tax=Actinomyces sp. ZJ308 TaxID=2708342 RepID=UPI00141DD1A9|nr:ABC transporter permease [Actinomyces sp. ZJ308]